MISFQKYSYIARLGSSSLSRDFTDNKPTLSNKKRRQMEEMAVKLKEKDAHISTKIFKITFRGTKWDYRKAKTRFKW